MTQEKRRRRRRSARGKRQWQATLPDVAQHAGVSTATVSRCLNTPERVSSALRSRVEASIKALEYTPHGAARALVSRRSRTVGVIVPTLDIAGFAAAVQGLQERLSDAGYTPLLAISNFDLDLEFHHARNLVLHGVDGMMLVGVDHSDELFKLLQHNEIPYVNTWNLAQAGAHPCIGFDNRSAMRQITEYVLDQGHRRIGLILGGLSQRNDRTRDRLKGFRDAIAARGVDVPSHRIMEVTYSMNSGQYGLQQLVTGNEPPTAVLCSSDLFAVGAMFECQRRGIRVPEELSLTGFDNLEVASHIVPALTTVAIPARQMGLGAAEHLLASIDDEAGPNRVELSYELIIRDSVAPPRKTST